MANSISLDELVALNDEIAGLVRSGVPLELGLAGWGRDLPGNLGRVVTRLAEGVARGQGLSQALAEQEGQFPPVYRAVVVAGIRSGRLPAALESLATSARNLQEVRRSVGLALLYPSMLVVLAYFLFWLLLGRILPGLLVLYDGDPPRFWGWVADFGRLMSSEIAIPFTNRVIVAGWIPPLAVAVGALLWWLARWRGDVLGGGGPGRWLEWVPFAGQPVRHARLASLSEILGLLVEHDVPLGEAAVLAAECSADRRLLRTAHELASTLARGGTPPEPERLTEFPPLLAWLVSVGGRQQTFVTVARHVADTYRRRIVRESRWLREVLPMWLVVVIGGGLVALFGLTTFLPFTQLLENLSAVTGQSMRNPSVNTFAYTAVDTQGRPVRGTIEASDWNSAREQLMARGLGECAQDASCLAGSAVVATGALPRLSKAEAIDLATCLSALARAGLPMAAGVRAVARDLPAGQLPGALDALAARLEGGQPLETAVAALGSGVPEHLRELMVVGARSGRLAETLDEVLAHERVIDDMGRRLWQVVTYPAVLFAFLVVWLLFVSLWLIPQIQASSILTDIDEVYATYPFTTSNRVVVPNYGRRLGEFSAITPPAILTVFCGLLVTVGTARAIGGRALVSRLFAHVPLLGPARWYRSLVEFCGLLAVFLKQQLPLGEALRLTSLAARDAAIRSAAAQASRDVAAGRSLADCMSGETLFPPTLVNLVEWGGRHDALADSLASAAAMYRDRFELQLRLVRIVLPPIVFLLVGATVLFVVYGLLGSISTAIRLMVYY